MNISMKKFLLAIGVAALLQPNIFSMALSSSAKQAAIKREFKKAAPNFDKLDAMIAALPTGDKSKAFFAKKSAELKRAPNIASKHTIVKDIEETVTEVTASPAQERALDVLNEVKNITAQFIEKSQFNVALDKTVKAELIPMPGIKNPTARNFAVNLNRVISSRNKHEAGNQHIGAAFQSGKVLFYQEVERLFDMPKESLEKVYLNIMVGPDQRIGSFLVISKTKPKEMIRDANDWPLKESSLESTLIQILPSMAILADLYSGDGATKTQMQKDLKLMQAITAASYELFAAIISGKKDRFGTDAVAALEAMKNDYEGEKWANGLKAAIANYRK